MVLSAVKTTLKIPDTLFRRAKVTAAKEGKARGHRKKQAWRSVFGKLSAEGKKASRAVDAVIKPADFNKVDPEAWQ